MHDIIYIGHCGRVLANEQRGGYFSFTRVPPECILLKENCLFFKNILNVCLVDALIQGWAEKGRDQRQACIIKMDQRINLAAIKDQGFVLLH